MGRFYFNIYFALMLVQKIRISTRLQLVSELFLLLAKRGFPDGFHMFPAVARINPIGSLFLFNQNLLGDFIHFLIDILHAHFLDVHLYIIY